MRPRASGVRFETAPLAADVTLGGEIWARLHVSTTGTDADYVVKLIDVYKPTEPDSHTGHGPCPLAGYEQLVAARSCARFRQSFADPEPRMDAKSRRYRSGSRTYCTSSARDTAYGAGAELGFPAFDRNP